MGIKELIKSCSDHGAKKNELIVDVIGHYHKHTGKVLTAPEIIRALGELIEAGELVELEYVLPDSDYRVRRIYFPKGTEIRIVNPKAGVVRFG